MIVGREDDTRDLFPRDVLSPGCLRLGHVPQPQSVVGTGGDQTETAVVSNIRRDPDRRMTLEFADEVARRDVPEIEALIVRIRRGTTCRPSGRNLALLNPTSLSVRNSCSWRACGQIPEANDAVRPRVAEGHVRLAVRRKGRTPKMSLRTSQFGYLPSRPSHKSGHPQRQPRLFPGAAAILSAVIFLVK